MAHTILTLQRTDVSCLPELFSGLTTRMTVPYYIPLSLSYASLHTEIAAAFLVLNHMEITDAEAFCTVLENGKIAAEVWSPSLRRSSASVYDPQTGQLFAARISEAGELSPLPALVKTSKDIEFNDMLALFMPLVANCIAIGNLLYGEWDKFFNGLTTGVAENIYALCEMVCDAINTKKIPLSAFPKGDVPVMGTANIQVGTYALGKRLCGSPHMLAGKNGRMTAVVSVKKAKEEFEAYISAQKWTKEEKMLIPTLPDDYPVPAETLKIARRFLATQKDLRPMVQFMWRGPTSIGKSTGIECLAAVLHMPLVRITCHPNMETQDFLADFVPDTTGSASAELPSFEDIELDPCGAYEILTGVYDEDATCQMCLEEYGKAVAARSGTPRFKFVESNYVKALTRGYLCEVQEASRIRNSGVLVGLNEFDRPGSVIPLLDGSYQKRHAQAIVVFTDNTGYASCRPIDPSVIRRMSFVLDSSALPKEELFHRVQYNTGCTDESLLEQMYRVFQKIEQYCADNDLRDEASLSATEFEMWVRCVLLDGMDTMQDSVQECVISKVTSDPERQMEIMDTIVSVNLL